MFGGSFYVVVSASFSHTEWGWCKRFPTFKRGVCEKCYPVLSGGGAQKVLDPQCPHFVAPPPLPIMNDQSLHLSEQ